MLTDDMYQWIDKCVRSQRAKHQDYCGCASLPTTHFSLNDLHAGGPLPSAPSLVRWVAAALVCETVWSWVFVVRGLSHVCQTTLTVTNRLKGVGSRKCHRPCENVTFRLC